MKRFRGCCCLGLLLLLAWPVPAAQLLSAIDEPVPARIYQLDNGMRVYLAKNTAEPRVQVLVAFNSGSAVEPADSTGLAHYLEHLLFKGTSRLGALEWEREAPLLQRISDLYEAYRATADPEERQRLYAEIDRVSGEAAAFSTGGEYNLLAAGIGATGTNAFTSWDQTVYVNDVPVNQLDKLLTMEAERFQDPVMRRFHTELEAVYEEFNRMQDNDMRRAQSELFDQLFERHPYGRAIIGYPEHLKNPSLVNLKKFYAAHYVPANLAIVIAGDIDYEATLAMVETHFGAYAAVELPPPVAYDEPELTAAEPAVVTGPGPEILLLGARFAATPENRRMLPLIDGLLSYRDAGRLDDLMRAGTVQQAGSGLILLRDYFIQMFFAMPRPGQTLEEARELLLAELDRLKRGEFPDWQLEAIVNNLYYDWLVGLENRENAAMWLLDVYNHAQSPEEAIADYEAMRQVTKAQVMAFVAAHYPAGVVTVFKRTGSSEALVKVEKPAITPVPLNDDRTSQWGMTFLEVPAGAEPEPVFLDFAKDLPMTSWGGADFYYRHNARNARFSLALIWPGGKFQDLELPLALEYWQLLGAGEFGADELMREWFRLGISLKVSVGEDRTIVTLDGLQENFDAALQLLQVALRQAKNDPEAYRKLVDRILKQRADARKSPEAIADALWNYGVYGADNPSRVKLTEAQLRAMDPEALLRKVAALGDFRHDVFYFGPESQDAAERHIRAAWPVDEHGAVWLDARRFQVPEFTENRVYLVEFPMSQLRMTLVRREAEFQPDMVEYQDLYNAYVGPAAYQELREARALAYVAASYMAKARKAGDFNLAVTRLDTQADKLPEALSAMLAFSAAAPQAEQDWLAARGQLISALRAGRVLDEEIYSRFDDYRRRGVDYDLRRTVYQRLPSVTLAAFTAYFNANIAPRPGHLMVMGEVGGIDRKVLEAYGKIQELTLDELF